MATRKAAAREDRRAVRSRLEEDPAAVLREEVRLIREELIDQGRRAALGAGLLGAAGVIGLGAFGALTTAAITALGRQDTARGALLIAAAYGATAGALAEVGVRRLGRVGPEALENLQEDVKTAAKAVKRVA